MKRALIIALTALGIGCSSMTLEQRLGRDYPIATTTTKVEQLEKQYIYSDEAKAIIYGTASNLKPDGSFTIRLEDKSIFVIRGNVHVAVHGGGGETNEEFFRSVEVERQLKKLQEASIDRTITALKAYFILDKTPEIKAYGTFNPRENKFKAEYIELENPQIEEIYGTKRFMF